MVKLNLEEEDAAASCSLDNSAESGKVNYSNNNCSENRYDWEKKISRSPTLLLDPKPPKFRKRCRQVQRTFPFSSNESRFDQYILSADHKHVFVHPQEGIPVAPPLNLMKTLQSKYIHDEFFKSPIVRSGINVIVIPSAQCMYDSIDDIARRIGLREISFSFSPVEQDFSMGHIRSRSASTADMRSFDTARTPAICSQLQVDTKLAINLRKQDSEAKGCPTMTVSSSYLSTSSLAHRSVTSAIVYCVWENKLPYFLFIVDDDEGEIFVANAMKVKSSADQTFDYIYVFHAWEVSGKASKKNVTSSPRVVAKMTVSNSLIVSSNRSKFMETQFIMFDAKEEHLAGKDEPLSNCNKINRLTKKVSEIFRPSSLLKQNPKPKDIYELDSQFEVLMQTIDESQFLDHYYTNNFLPIFELAAIVVRDDHRYKSSKEEPCGGWGFKFLEKSPNDAAQLLQSYCPRSCRNDDTVKKGKSLTVVVPAGVHGGPATKAGGPSSLTDRWKSNGVCGCGGWDVGCPLKVLQNDSADLGGDQEDCKSLELFIEGGKRSVSEPSFKVVNMSKGVYLVNFDPTLSAPQSFSVAVAFIHSQAPELCPQL